MDWTYLRRHNSRATQCVGLDNGDMKLYSRPCVPWLVLCLLYRFNKKHNVLGRSYIDASRYTHYLAGFENKLRWRVLLRDDSSPMPLVKVSHAVTPACTSWGIELVMHSLQVWLHHVRARMTSAFRITRSRFRSAGCFAYRTPLIRVGLRLLRHHSLTAT